ncbi:trigger factor family protein, partial [Candidatus Saccharibacteria bacterium]|nr:trigger factor family protein [Candidatus Saccharibacteria bacterium]
MKTKFKKISDTRVEITVTLDKKDLAEAEKKALEKLSKEVRVEGFRKGKAPADVAKKFIPENDLNAEAIDIAIRTSVIPAFREHEKMPLVMPNVNVTKYVPGEMAEYTATAEIIPEVKLGDYKNLKVKKEKANVTETQIKEILDNLA